jgi:hypothetical protein
MTNVAKQLLAEPAKCLEVIVTRARDCGFWHEYTVDIVDCLDDHAKWMESAFMTSLASNYKEHCHVPMEQSDAMLKMKAFLEKLAGVSVCLCAVSVSVSVSVSVL